MRKGIILAGGAGTRLHPVTYAVSKQLLPVYDKPMVYYSLSTLMLAGIRDILLISTPTDLPRLSAPARRWQALGTVFVVMPSSPGPRVSRRLSSLAEASSPRIPVALVLGDNLFYGPRVVRAAAKGVRSDPGRDRIRLSREGSAALWRRELRCGGPGARH